MAGSTDDLPIATLRFPSNWELSVVRATTVVRFLSECGVKPERMLALGYGEYHPLYPNDTPAGKAKNRRVDIIIYSKPPFLGNEGQR